MKNLMIVLLILISLISCDSTSEKLNPVSEVLPRGILRKHDSILIDTTVILENKNLNRLILLIEKQNLKTDSSKTSIPKVVFSFLKTLSTDSFSIANSNENWQVGCTVLGLLPKRQLNYLGQSNALTVLTYYKGGWGKSGHILIIDHDDKTILDFWIGSGFDLNNKDTIIKYLRHKNEFHHGLLDI